MRTRCTQALEQQAILEWFAVKGIFAMRLNVGAIKLESRFLRFGPPPGCSDVIAFPWFPGATHPATVFVEVKSATGRQRPEQKSFAQQVEDAGMHYLLARSVDDVETWCREHFKEAA